MQETLRNHPELVGFRLIPNPEAQLIQDTLGIEFEEIPYKTMFDLHSRWQYLKRKPSFGLGLASIVGDFLTKPQAMYDHTKNIVFSNGDRHDDLHENGHAWVAQINPEILVGKGLIAKAAEERKREIPDSGISESEIEKAVCFQCFDEGMPEWIAQETERRIREKAILGPRLPEVFPEDKVFLATEETSRILALRQDEFDIKFDQLRRAVDKFKEGLGYTGLPMLRRFLQAMISVTKIKEEIGNYFCLEAMNEIINKGIPLREALELLAKNPPEKISQLENPEEYIALILA